MQGDYLTEERIQPEDPTTAPPPNDARDCGVPDAFPGPTTTTQVEINPVTGDGQVTTYDQLSGESTTSPVSDVAASPPATLRAPSTYLASVMESGTEEDARQSAARSNPPAIAPGTVSDTTTLTRIPSTGGTYEVRKFKYVRHDGKIVLCYDVYFHQDHWFAWTTTKNHIRRLEIAVDPADVAKKEEEYDALVESLAEGYAEGKTLEEWAETLNQVKWNAIITEGLLVTQAGGMGFWGAARQFFAKSGAAAGAGRGGTAARSAASGIDDAVRAAPSSVGRVGNSAGEVFEESVKNIFRKKIIRQNEVIRNRAGKVIAEIDFETAEAIVEVGTSLQRKVGQLHKLAEIAKQRGKRLDVIYGPDTSPATLKFLQESLRKKWGNRVRFIPHG